MHSEHMVNVRPSWIAFGWFLSAAASALVLFGFLAIGLVPASGEGGRGWTAAALALGFAAGGFLTGSRVRAAPLLHGVGIGLFSLVAWFLVNLVLGEPTGTASWRTHAPGTAAGLLLLQIIAASAGAWVAIRPVSRS